MESISLYQIYKQHGVSYQALNSRIERLGIDSFYTDSILRKGRKMLSVNIDDVEKLLSYDWKKDPNNKKPGGSGKAGGDGCISRNGSKDEKDNIRAGYYGRITAIGRMRTEQGFKHE